MEVRKFEGNPANNAHKYLESLFSWKPHLEDYFHCFLVSSELKYVFAEEHTKNLTSKADSGNFQHFQKFKKKWRNCSVGSIGDHSSVNFLVFRSLNTAAERPLNPADLNQNSNLNMKYFVALARKRRS